MNTLFSVVVPHYSQSDIWKDTVKSILSQDYPAIELIFADDCSPNFDLFLVEDYIRNLKKENLVRFEVCCQTTNVGTVENLRRAHKLCTGEYLTHIAADDVYISERVLSSFVECLVNKQEDVLGVYGQSHLCNRELEKLEKTYFEEEKAQKLNFADSAEQFFELAQGCCIPMGATAFLREEYMKHEVSDKYRLLEDWPFFINAVKEGKRFVFGGFDVLLYREGGISRNTVRTPAQIQCFKDSLLLYESDIFPHLSICSLEQKMRIYYGYNQFRIEVTNLLGELSSQSRIELLLPHKKLMLCLLAERIKSAKLISLCVVLWLIGAIILTALKASFRYQLCLLAGVFSAYSFICFLKAIRKILIFLTS